MQRSARLILRVAVALLVLAPASAQRFLVAQRYPMAVLMVDCQAGVIIEDEIIDLSTTGALYLSDAARVHSQVWVTTPIGIHRYQDGTWDSLGVIDTQGVNSYGIQAVPGGAWVVSANGNLNLYDLSGNLQHQEPMPGALDVFLWRGDLLVSTNSDNSIRRYDPAGNYLGYLTAPYVTGLANGQMAARPSNGNLLLTGDAWVFEIDPMGQVVDFYQCGFLEESTQELSDGRLMVFLANGSNIIDTSGVAYSVGPVPGFQSGGHLGFSPYDAGSPRYRRYCDAAPNSSGLPVHINAIGYARVAEQELTLNLWGASPDDWGFVVYGNPGPPIPFGDGRLCLSPFAPGVVRTASIGPFDASGSRRFITLNYTDFSPSAPVIAGSRWAFQCLYRDSGSVTAGFNTSDAIELSFD